MSEAPPTPEQEQRARWELLLSDLEYRRKQSRWETPKAVAMIALALAALLAAVRIVDLAFPPKAQTIIVHFDQPPLALPK